MPKELPIGIPTFSELIQKNYVYVDKTNIIYQLVSRKKYYFLNRPRRFGKSLLVSTLEAIFLGKKELFSGLAIDSLSYDWQQYPVISISFSDIAYSTPKELVSGIKVYLQRIAQSYSLISLDEKLTPGEMLQALVIELAKQNSVALLIDEYDYAILQHVHNPDMAGIMRETLKSFYAVIKGLDKYLRFVFFTGVSKFSQTSIFSGLNNLQDIALKPEFNALLGYTQDEITTYFEQHLVHTASKLKCSVDQLLADMKTWYDGYQFTIEENSTKIYNPFSVLLFLDNSRFSNYWFQTGTPTFLINLLKTNNYPMQDFEKIKVTEDDLGAFDVDNIPLATILYQTGYLTIYSYNTETSNYTLSYPNLETTNSLISYIFDAMTHTSKAYLNDITIALLRAFENNNREQVSATLTSLFATIPYNIQINEEKYYQTIFYLVLKMIGADIIVEQPTNIGRIDAVIQTKTSYFVIEFKINSSALKALEQIESKKYYQPYELLGKKITLVGIAFDTALKNVSEIEYREL